jgi:predicted enzyme related to lactoylglutathione lyase
MAITAVTVRIHVDDLDAVVPFYEALTGERADRFEFSGAQLAAIGPFLLFCASGELGHVLERVHATISTDDLDAEMARLTECGAVLIAPPADTPGGRRTVVRHPDGAVFEYIGH